MKPKKKAILETPLSFGANPEDTKYHFLVNLTDGKSPYVYISEHDELFDNIDRQKIEYEIPVESPRMRVVLSRDRWNAIQDTIGFDFNKRMKLAGLKSSQFKKGYNFIPRLFGKELTLLCWAIEEADPGDIPIALKNWLGLKPEERWWLYTMTAAATGQALKNRSRGWRKAVRYALTENPIDVG